MRHLSAVQVNGMMVNIDLQDCEALSLERYNLLIKCDAMRCIPAGVRRSRALAKAGDARQFSTISLLKKPFYGTNIVVSIVSGLIFLQYLGGKHGLEALWGCFRLSYAYVHEYSSVCIWIFFRREEKTRPRLR